MADAGGLIVDRRVSPSGRLAGWALIVLATGLVLAVGFGGGLEWVDLVVLAFALPMAALGAAVLRVHLVATTESITTTGLLSSRSVPWSQVGGIFVERDTKGSIGIVATDVDGRLLPLGLVPRGGISAFDGEEIAATGAALIAHLEAVRPAGTMGAAGTVGTAVVTPERDPVSAPADPIAYRAPGWGTAGGTVLVVVLIAAVTAVVFGSAVRGVPALFVLGPLLWSFVRGPHRPGRVMLSADRTGITWVEREPVSAPWSQVVDLRLSTGRSPSLLLFLATDHTARRLPLPPRADAALVRDELLARRPPSGVSPPA